MCSKLADLLCYREIAWVFVEVFAKFFGSTEVGIKIEWRILGAKEMAPVVFGEK